MSTPAQKEAPQAVTVVIRRPDDGRYLIIQRSHEGSAGGYWVPVSGRPEPGETLAQTAAREAREEVGLEIEVGQEVYRCHSVGERWLLIWLEATAPRPQPLTLQAEEVARALWVTAAEATRLEPMFDATRRFFAQRAALES